MIGQSIQNYQVTAHLGEGGMGTVYKATDTVLGREVALKMLHTPLMNQDQFLERFRKEARILAQLLHPNIAVIYNFIEQNNSHYMVMEYVEGKNLDSLLRQQRILPYQLVVPVFVQALEGLHHAHKKGIFHRDIKPSNLILTPDGTVKLMDFGIAKMAGEQRMTQVNRVVGTVEFMAPELIQGKDPSVSSDIYATAITMYELLTGKLPFESTTDYNLMQEIMQKKPSAPDKLNADIPRPLSTILLKAMEKKPENRYPDARALQQALLSSFPGLTTINLELLNKPVPATQFVRTGAAATMATQLDNRNTRDQAIPAPFIAVLRERFSNLNKKQLAIGAVALLLLISLAAVIITSTKDEPVAGNLTKHQNGADSTAPVSNRQQNPQSDQLMPVNRVPENGNNTNTPPPADKVEPLAPANEGTEKKKETGKTKEKEPEKTNPAPPVKEEKPVPPPETVQPKEVTKVNTPVADEPVKRSARTISLHNKTEVSLYLQQSINAATAYEGQGLSFTVTRPVYYDGEVIIEKGATATGRITKAGNKKLGLVISSVTAANGQRIPLQETELSGRIEEILSSRNYSAYLKKGITLTL
jgi:serine/threonine-protein kinase